MEQTRRSPRAQAINSVSPSIASVLPPMPRSTAIEPVHDVALHPVGEPQAMNPKPIQSRFLNDDRFDPHAVALLGLAIDRERRSSRHAPSQPSTTGLENFSLPGLLIVTTRFDLLNSSEAEQRILFARAVVGDWVLEVRDGFGCLHARVKLSLPSQAAVHPHSIFFRALDTLAGPPALRTGDDCGGWAGLARGGLAALDVERMVTAIERALPAP